MQIGRNPTDAFHKIAENIEVVLCFEELHKLLESSKFPKIVDSFELELRKILLSGKCINRHAIPMLELIVIYILNCLID